MSRRHTRAHTRVAVGPGHKSAVHLLEGRNVASRGNGSDRQIESKGERRSRETAKGWINRQFGIYTRRQVANICACARKDGLATRRLGEGRERALCSDQLYRQR